MKVTMFDSIECPVKRTVGLSFELCASSREVRDNRSRLKALVVAEKIRSRRQSHSSIN
jgi:hypothetical protein